LLSARAATERVGVLVATAVLVWLEADLLANSPHSRCANGGNDQVVDTACAVDVLIWLGPPFLLGGLLGAAFPKGRVRSYGLPVLGLLIGFGFILYAYLVAAPDYEHSGGCEHCQMFLGRYWEPVFVTYLSVIGYVIYLLGIGAGALMRLLVKTLLGSRPISN
jgi:hypothetical protein